MSKINENINKIKEEEQGIYINCYNYDVEFSDINSFIINAPDIVFYTISLDKKLSDECIKLFEAELDYLRSYPVIILQDIDKNWNKLSSIKKMLINFLIQQEPFNYYQFASNYVEHGFSYYYNVFGINPLPEMDKIQAHCIKKLQEKINNSEEKIL